MIPQKGLLQAVQAADLGEWTDALTRAIERSQRHGNLPSWLRSLQAMPAMQTRHFDFTSDYVSIGLAQELSMPSSQLADQLKTFAPWRKGPFRLFGVDIDSEWRSDWKWRRILPVLHDIAGKRVLDVGCGNGYYALRLAGLGAQVFGVEPHMLYLAQFIALTQYLAQPPCWILPCPLEDLPARAKFDVVLSMGVIYHRRSPLEHLLLLKDMLKPGGKLILESIVIDGDAFTAMVPPQRYARMRNVWFVPSRLSLQVWLQRCGYISITELHHGYTSTQEQRQTPWMLQESLADGLNPEDSQWTIEGLPAPQRVVITAEKPPGHAEVRRFPAVEK